MLSEWSSSPDLVLDCPLTDPKLHVTSRIIMVAGFLLSALQHNPLFTGTRLHALSQIFQTLSLLCLGVGC